MNSSCFVFALLLVAAVLGGGTQADTSEQCVKSFIPGRKDFVLDPKESIKDGATFLANPNVSTADECNAACCRESACNLALTEHAEEEGSINTCFLFNCVYKQRYVCRFIHKQGYSSHIKGSVYEDYLVGGKSDRKDKPPIANAGPSIVVQPNAEVLLNGIESWDDKKIVSYQWTLIQGDESVVIEKTNLPDQIRVSKLIPGVYEFKLTVTDSAEHSDSDKVTVLVLTPEQSERHCLVPKKVGPCRGSFPRWHYNAATSKCEQFMFGGCKENKNNYLSEQECTDACKNTIVKPGGEARKTETEDCNSPCGEDKFKCSNNCCVKKESECDGQTQCSDHTDEESCERLDSSLSRLLHIQVSQNAFCAEPPVTGHCRASFTRWYYDPLNKKCQRFTYGGCNGNENNFESTDACMNNCSDVTENDVFARGLFVRGDEELGESQSASVALAVVLAVAIMAVLAVLGYCYLKSRRKNQQHQRVATTSPPVVYSEDADHLVYNSTTAKA
ncbi:kunitz-type protease inhibitor 1b [Myxocyprinus asiaticus]|uniref:kunitz-type protease inhibitor 1b n=1 Tax=Myxocyprinus asiaticus TaxID=70543 RepID=UPI00222341C5|nr:kunitz-type protease inhibitor 1b [Myxocyprinus asiaticus]